MSRPADDDAIVDWPESTTRVVFSPPVRIDVFCHCFPTRCLAERKQERGRPPAPDDRWPHIESITEPRDPVELARMANDGLICGVYRPLPS